MKINVDAVAMDYDRTIADEKKGFRISDDVKKQLLLFDQFKLILATGRMSDDIPDRDVLEIFDAMVTENGTIVSFDGGKRKKVLVNDEGWKGVRSEIADIMADNRMPMFKGEVVLAGYKDDTPKLCKKLRSAGLSKKIELQFNKEGVLILPKGWDKGRGVREAMEVMGCKRYLGIGDDLNDLALLKKADVAVAVMNAVPELKMIADIICDKENGYGVVEVLKHVVGYKP